MAKRYGKWNKGKMGKMMVPVHGKYVGRKRERQVLREEIKAR